jgi:hypothetical protein
MGTAGWIVVGLGGWFLAGLWLALAFGRAARDDPTAPRHEPEVRRRLLRRQRLQSRAVGNRGEDAQSGQRDVTSASATGTAMKADGSLPANTKQRSSKYLNNAAMNAGDVVVDLGSGAGFECRRSSFGCSHHTPEAHRKVAIYV